MVLLYPGSAWGVIKVENITEGIIDIIEHVQQYGHLRFVTVHKVTQ